MSRWPTFFVLDAQGVIRHKGSDGKAAIAAVRELLADRGKPGGPSA